jgi:hypothetical protein
VLDADIAGFFDNIPLRAITIFEGPLSTIIEGRMIA